MKTSRRTSKPPLGAFAAALALSLALPGFAAAATFTVNSTADTVDANPGDGTCADSTGACTLRAAVMEANALAGADTINLTQINSSGSPITLSIHGADESYVVGKSGKATVSLTHDASIGDLNLTDSVVILGAGSGKTIIQWSAGDQAEHVADRIFHVEAVNSDVTVTITGVTLRNGFTPAVFDIPEPDSLVLAPVAKIWRFKRDGGCLAVGPSALTGQFDPTDPNSDGQQVNTGPDSGFAVESVTLNDVRVLDCISGNNGGGIYSTSELTVNSSIISGNTAVWRGGGIYNSGPLTLNQTTVGQVINNANFGSNSAEQGGGIYDTGLHTATINASALAGNVAAYGGGMAAVSTDVDDFVNSSVVGNVAHISGAGVRSDGDVNFTNSTVAGNAVVPLLSLVPPPPATPVAGLEPYDTGAFTYVNTIISNNSLVGETPVLSNCGYTGSGPDTKHLMSSGHNLEDSGSCNLNQAGDLIDTDPKLGPLAGNGGPTQTMAIGQNSPALDAGDNGVCPNNDQRGELRPADGNLDGTFICDIGAFEYFAETADLHIQNAMAPDQVYTGESFTISVQAHNDPAASGTATGVVITTSALPADFTLTSAKFSIGGVSGSTDCSVTGGVVTCNVGDLLVGELATLVITGSASAPGSMTVTATVSDTAPTDPVPTNNTDSVRINVLGQSDMGITASGPSATVDSGSDISMTFAAHNYGSDTAHDARIAIFLPDGLLYKSVNISDGDCSYSSGDNSVLCTIGTMASGTTVSGTLTATVDGNGSAVTLFAVTADELDTDALNNQDAVLTVTGGGTGPASGVADLAIKLEFENVRIYEHSTELITVTVTNLGPSTPTRVLADVLVPEALMWESASPGSNCAPSGLLRSPHGTLVVVSCTWSGLTVGESKTAQFSLTDSSIGTFPITAVVTSELSDPATQNNKATDTIVTYKNSGGGCAFRPNSPFDPTLPALFVASMLGLAIRNRTRAAGRH
ncbi:MAG TPA: choice-of-anchor Q domain-containing protein [Gammaproteobacteria bacterium]|nr:choice-of-anchor Q domain-containing protein [Gammaproteobacteria bacterium]